MRCAGLDEKTDDVAARIDTPSLGTIGFGTVGELVIDLCELNLLSKNVPYGTQQEPECEKVRHV